MSLGSSAEIIPFKRFLECRQRRQIAAANGIVVMPASTDVGIRPEGAGTANADDGASPPPITRPTRRHRMAARPSLRPSVVTGWGRLVAGDVDDQEEIV